MSFETKSNRIAKKTPVVGTYPVAAKLSRLSALPVSEVQPCASLIVDLVPPLARLLRSHIAPAMGFGVSLAQFNLLSALAAKSTLNNNELADGLGVSLPVSTRQVDNLVLMKLVERIRDDGDRRHVRLTLTSKGRAIHKQVHQRVTHALFSKLHELRAQDRKTLEKGLSILAILIGSLHEASEHNE